jgi:hypothetical protein
MSLFSARNTARHELDLVIEKSDEKVVGVEVKASMTVKAVDFKGLSSFADYAKDRFLHGVLGTISCRSVLMARYFMLCHCRGYAVMIATRIMWMLDG